jgi:hypothetical protein
METYQSGGCRKLLTNWKDKAVNGYTNEELFRQPGCYMVYAKKTKKISMADIKDIELFKTHVASTLVNYELQYRFYEKGDFGSLSQVIFNSPQNGGGIDFWGKGWLGIDLHDYEKDEQVLNVLLEPNQKEEKAFDRLLILLKS